MFHVLATLVMMLTPLQLTCVHHYPSCDGYACDAEENRMQNKSLAEKNVAKERWSMISIHFYKAKKCKM